LTDMVRSAVDYYQLKAPAGSFVSDLVTTVPLFVRDGALYSWSHKSFQDYFAARFLEADAGDLAVQILRRIYDNSEGDRFAHLLQIYREVSPRGYRQTLLRWFLEDYEAHCRSIEDAGERPAMRTRVRHRRLFGREVSLMVFSEQQSEVLRSLGHDDRVTAMLKAWGLSDVSDLRPGYQVFHNRQRQHAVAILDRWSPRVHMMLRVMEHGGAIASASYALTLPDSFTFTTANPVKIALDTFDDDPRAYDAINELLLHGFRIDHEAAGRQLARIRDEEKRDTAAELLDF
jgi:hypothetical protein